MCIPCDYANAAQTSIEILLFNSKNEIEIQKQKEGQREFFTISRRDRSLLLRSLRETVQLRFVHSE